MHAIVEKMIAVAEDLGVQFHYNHPVGEIKTEKSKTTGLILADGQVIQSDIVVANADLPYVYRELLPSSLKASWINRHQFTCSALVFHWGLDKAYTELSHHNVFLVDDFKGALDAIFKQGTLGQQPCFYIHAPRKTDPEAAPEGQDTISVVIPVPNLKTGRDLDWQSIKESAREAVFTRLAKAGLSDVKDHIKFEICHLPEDWESRVNVTKGATFGSLSHKIFQMGYFRPHNRHPQYKNLYFVGGSTHPGNGIPLILLSGKLTAERIVHDQINRSKP